MENGKLNFTYFIPDGKTHTDISKQRYKMVYEQYDCCENTLLLKTYQGVLKKIVDNFGGEEAFKVHIEKI